MDTATLAPLPASNPFSRPWQTEGGIPDFSAVRPEHVEPAVRLGMREQREEWESVATCTQPPTVANTVHALEVSGDLLDRALTVFFSLTAATDSPELDELEQRLAPELAAHADAYELDPRLYERFRALDELMREAQKQGEQPRDSEGTVIDAETARYIRREVEDRERNGVALRGAQAEELRSLNEHLASLSTQIGTHITAAMHEAGVDNFSIPEALASLQDPQEREALLARSLSRGLHEPGDIREDVLRLLRLRAQRARLLGMANHAELVVSESAAPDTAAVSHLLMTVAAPAMEHVRRSAADLSTRMEADGQRAEDFGPAHWPYYAAARQRELFTLDDQVIRSYCRLERVISHGIFEAAHRLYGLGFLERPDLQGLMYDPSMRVWAVYDAAPSARLQQEPGADSPLVGYFVGDYLARPGKSGGAWADNLVDQSHLEGTLPVIINCANFTPDDDGAVRLSWDDVVTCFHEFGHALHGLLANSTYASLSGMNVARDVVEFPSQVNEIWAEHPQILACYTRHEGTGEAMPAELMERLQAQVRDGEDYRTAEYVGAALLDHAWHTLPLEELPSDPQDVEATEERILRAAGLDPALVPPRYRTTYFSHILDGGYSAAYYAYMWSEMMVADAAQWFATEGCGARDGDGGLNREAGAHLRATFLSRGDSRDPAVSYRDFAGRDPGIAPLLARRGLSPA